MTWPLFIAIVGAVIVAVTAAALWWAALKHERFIRRLHHGTHTRRPDAYPDPHANTYAHTDASAEPHRR